MLFSEPTSDFLQPEDLQALSVIRSDQGPIISLYLDLRDDLSSETYLDRFERLLLHAEQKRKLKLDSPAYQEHWEQDADRIRTYLLEKPASAHGLAIFSSSAAGVWQVLLLPFPVHDRLTAAQRADVRPLEVLMAESKCTLVILMDAGLARFLQTRLGMAREVTQMQAMPVTGELSADDLRQHAAYILEQINILTNDNDCERLIIGGDGAAIHALQAAMPDALRDRVIGELHLSPSASIGEILERTREIEYAHDEVVEAQRVQHMLNRVRERKDAVLGLEQVMMSVQRERVNMVIVDQGYQQEGGVCPNCGLLWEWDQGACHLCGTALRPEQDIIEAALKDVLDQGGNIEVLRTDGARKALAESGRIGALVMSPGAHPTVKETANQNLILFDDKINQDVLHDETIEESFPASDPPSRRA